MIFQTCGQVRGVSGRIRIDLDFITPLESFMNTSIPYRATTPWNDDPRAIKRRCRAFTLIELLVVFIIISILSSLMLAGLAGARQRAKTDKTKSTIRKIDSVIRPMFDSYRTRRVDIPPHKILDAAHTVSTIRSEIDEVIVCGIDVEIRHAFCIWREIRKPA